VAAEAGATAGWAKHNVRLAANMLREAAAMTTHIQNKKCRNQLLNHGGQAAARATSSHRTFIPTLIELYRQGRFPFDRLVRFYRFDEINQAMADSESGVTIKPILKMSA
jgi:Zn-dependent alcohol dehydrogenase